MSSTEVTAVTAVSLRVGQIRLDDIAPQIGRAPCAEVVVVDPGGEIQRVLVTFTGKWSGGWHRALECSRCHSPARVLHVEAGSGLCQRCCSRLTFSQRYRNSGSWTRADELLDKLARSLLKSPAKALNIRDRRLAHRVTRRALDQVAHVVDRARELVRAADTLLAARPDIREAARHNRDTSQKGQDRNATTTTT